MEKMKGKINPKKITRQMITDFAEQIDLPVSEWQVDIAYRVFHEGILYLSAPRRCGKTQISILIMLISAFLGRSALFLIHSKDGTRDVMNRVIRHSRVLEEQGYVERILKSNGFHEVYFRSGGRIFFRVRGEGVGVSLAFDTVVWDEAQKIKASTVEEIAPVMQEFEHPIQLFIGTPPTEKDFELYGDGNPFIAEKKNSMNGKNISYVEFSAFDDYDPDRNFTYHDARRANPSWKRMPDFWPRLKEVRRNISHESFARQYLGIWVFPQNYEVKEPYLTSSEISSVIVNSGSESHSFVAGVGILPHSSECFVVFSDGVVFELVEVFDTDWSDYSDIVDFLFARRRMLKRVVLPKNSLGSAIANKLIGKKMSKNKVSLVSMVELNASSFTFLKQLKGRELKIFNNDRVRIALSGFTLEYSEKWGVNEARTAVPEDLALLYGFFNAVCSDDFLTRVEMKKSSESGVGGVSGGVQGSGKFYGARPFSLL